jgi:hypothetical protein
MKRRNFLVRTAVGALSASVFSVTGWLMGTRSLTMGTPGQWVNQWIDSCTGHREDCVCVNASGSSCSVDTSCPPGNQCRWSEYVYYECCTPSYGDICLLRTRLWSCGGCTC